MAIIIDLYNYQGIDDRTKVSRLIHTAFAFRYFKMEIGRLSKQTI